MNTSEISVAAARAMANGDHEDVLVACQIGAEAGVESRIAAMIGTRFCSVSVTALPHRTGMAVARIAPRLAVARDW